MERHEPSVSPELAEGEILDDKYAIEALVGRMDACVEYRARQLGSGQLFRIKEYFPHQFAMRVGKVVQPAKEDRAGEFDFGLHRFVQVGQACMRLGHRNLQRYVGVFELNGTAYQVLEMPPGVAFEDWLVEAGGKVDQTAAEAIARQLCDALAYLHAAEQLHLNICPGTIFIEPQTMKLTLLEHYAAIRGLSMREASYWQGYFPPECASDERRRLETAASDIYSAGAVLLRAATGRAPPKVSDRAKEDTVAAMLREVEADYDQNFVRAIGKALLLSASERPKSVTEWRADLLPATARRALAGTRFKTLDQSPSQAIKQTRADSARGSTSLAIFASFSMTLLGMAVASEVRNPSRIKYTASDVVALRGAMAAPASTALPSVPAPVAAPKRAPVSPAPPDPITKIPAPIAPAPVVLPPAETPPPPVTARPAIPYPPPQPEIGLPAPSTPPEFKAPAPRSAEPKIALPSPIPLPEVLRRSVLRLEDTAVKVPASGEPIGEAALEGEWLAMAAGTRSPAVQLYKVDAGKFTRSTPPVSFPSVVPVAHLALSGKSAAEILVAAPDGSVSVLELASGRWQAMQPEAGVTKRVVRVTYDAVLETFAIVSVLRKGSSSTYTTILERFSAAKKKGATQVLLAESGLVQAAAISGRYYALMLNARGILVLDGGDNRRLLDHRTSEMLHVVEFSPAATYLAAAGEPSRVYLWEQSNGRYGEPKVLDIPDEVKPEGRDPPTVRSLSFSADRSHVAAGLSNGAILVWKLSGTNPLVATYKPSQDADVLSWLYFAQDAQARNLLIFPASDGSVRSIPPELIAQR